MYCRQAGIFIHKVTGPQSTAIKETQHTGGQASLDIPPSPRPGDAISAVAAQSGRPQGHSWTECLKRHPDGQRIVHSQDGLLSKPRFVLFSNLLDLDALLNPRRHRVEQDQNDGPLPLDLAFGIKELSTAC